MSVRTPVSVKVLCRVVVTAGTVTTLVETAKVELCSTGTHVPAVHLVTVTKDVAKMVLVLWMKVVSSVVMGLLGVGPTGDGLTVISDVMTVTLLVSFSTVEVRVSVTGLVIVTVVGVAAQCVHTVVIVVSVMTVPGVVVAPGQNVVVIVSVTVVRPPEFTLV